MVPLFSDVFPSIDYYYCYGNRSDDRGPVPADTEGARSMPPARDPIKEPQSSVPYTSITLVLQRITWFYFGPVVAMLCLVVIAQRGNGWLTIADLVYWSAVIATVGSRWLCFARGDRRDAYGEECTRQDVWRYSVMVAVGAGVAWIIANLAGNHLP